MLVQGGSPPHNPFPVDLFLYVKLVFKTLVPSIVLQYRISLTSLIHICRCTVHPIDLHDFKGQYLEPSWSRFSCIIMPLIKVQIFTPFSWAYDSPLTELKAGPVYSLKFLAHVGNRTQSSRERLHPTQIEKLTQPALVVLMAVYPAQKHCEECYQKGLE